MVSVFRNRSASFRLDAAAAAVLSEWLSFSFFCFEKKNLTLLNFSSGNIFFVSLLTGFGKSLVKCRSTRGDLSVRFMESFVLLPNTILLNFLVFF